MRLTLRHSQNMARDRRFRGYTGPTYQERQTVDRPVRKPGFISDFIVPLSAALAGAGLLSGAIVMVLSYIIKEPERGWMPLYWTSFLVVAFLLYILTQTAAWQLLWAWAEIVTRKDLDKSGNIGDKPILAGAKYGRTQPDTRHIRSAQVGTDESEDDDELVEEIDTWTPDLVVQHYPMDKDETVMSWFVRVAGEIGTASRIWEPILGRKRATNFRDALIAAGWASWKIFDADDQPVAQHGWQLDADPEEIRRHIK